LLSPLAWLPPTIGLLLVSAFSAVATLLLVKATSQAGRIEAAKRQMYAALLEMRLFNDDLRAVLRAAAELLWRDVAYLREFALPAILVSVPLTILLVHLDSFYGSTGLAIGQSALITASLKNSSPDTMKELPTARVTVPPGIRLDTPAVWFPVSHELIWQITPATPGRFDLVVGMGRQRVLKRVEVSEAIIRRAPSRIEQAWWADLFDPADQRLPSGGVIRSVDIQYPRREMSVWGWPVHWLVLFALSSMIFVLVLKRLLRVAL
jgi:hypothetical protein